MEEATYQQIEILSEKGNKLVHQNKYDEAIRCFEEALVLVPEPKNDWDATTWLLTALGDTYYFMKDYDKAQHYFYEAMNAPDGITNPFINLRLGECLVETGSEDQAREYLLRAYMMEGETIFQYEKPKYLKVIDDLI